MPGAFRCGFACALISSVIASVLLLLVVAVLSGGVVWLFLNEGRPASQSAEWVKESVTAWRSGELASEEYAVELEDAPVADVFSSFEQAEGDGYFSLDDVETAFKPVAQPLARIKAKRHPVA